MISEPAVLTLYPATVHEQRILIAQVASTFESSDFEWIADNREFAETERYVAKDAADDSLLTSSLITSERARIESFFSGDAVNGAKAYLQLFAEHILQLHKAFVHGATTLAHHSSQDLLRFWTYASTLAEVDNAHAMYLSSDNWTFSVFHKLIDELMAFAAPDDEAFAALLTAGIRDARTDIYIDGSFNAVYRGLQRAAFIRTLFAANDWIRDDGVMPLFAYAAATKPVDNSGALFDVANAYAQALVNLEARLAERERKRFRAVTSVYRNIYAARTAYDIYEYFGFYAFARHVTILKTCRALAVQHPIVARDFHYLASTYRFGDARRLLLASVKGRCS